MSTVPKNLKAKVLQWCMNGVDFDKLVGKIASIVSIEDGLEAEDIIHYLEDEGLVEKTDNVMSVIKLTHDGPIRSIEDQMCAIYDLAIQQQFFEAAIEIRCQLQKIASPS